MLHEKASMIASGLIKLWFSVDFELWISPMPGYPFATEDLVPQDEITEEEIITCKWPNTKWRHIDTNEKVICKFVMMSS